MVKKNITKSIELPPGPIDCACVIHGDGYTWDYVDRLYSMLCRHMSRAVNMHVYTEAERPVPAPYIKHNLENWGIGGPKKSWWYKMQLFNPELHSGPLLYFDLDVVIVKNIDWIWQSPLNYFWSVRDFKHLWRPTHYGINSSVMWFDTTTFGYVWRNFSVQELKRVIGKHQGDQDFLNHAIPTSEIKFFDTEKVKSWRWQCLDGGYHFTQKRHLLPNTGTAITDRTSVLVFHGSPKPDQVTDPVILQHWQ